MALAETRRRTLYDTCYLERMRRSALPLAPVDQAFRRTAESIGVPLA